MLFKVDGERIKKELFAQVESWEQALEKKFKLPESEGNIIFFSSGVGLAAAKLLAWTAGTVLQRPAFAIAAQDLLLHKEIIPTLNAALYVVIARTGKVVENITAIKAIRATDPKARIFGIIGEEPSRTGCLCDQTAVLDFGEQSITNTKTITSIILAAQTMLTREKAPEFYQSLKKLPSLLRKLFPEYERVTKELAAKQFDQIVFLGTGPHTGIAEAGVLAVLELSPERCHAYQSLVYLHGHWEMSKNYSNLIVAFVSSTGMAEELATLIRLVPGKVTLVCLGDLTEGQVPVDFINMDSGLSDAARSLLYLPFAQLLGVNKAMARGLK